MARVGGRIARFAPPLELPADRGWLWVDFGLLFAQRGHLPVARYSVAGMILNAVRSYWPWSSCSFGSAANVPPQESPLASGCTPNRPASARSRPVSF